jgi:hypothetical protein
MSDLQEISRVVYRHDWTSVDQWVSTLDQLADLTDDEIAEVEYIGKHPSPSSRSGGDRPAARRCGSEGGRSPSFLWSLAMTSLRWGCRLISFPVLSR